MDPIVAAGAASARRPDRGRDGAAQPSPQAVARPHGDRIVRGGPPSTRANAVAAMPLAEKVARTSHDAVAEAARHATGRLGALLRDPKVEASVAGGVAAFAAAQAVPGLDVAVDLSAGLAGVLAYGAAGREHRDGVAAAAGDLGAYARDVSGARTPPQLDAASHELAGALGRGGEEAVALVTTLGGAVGGALKAGAAAERMADAEIGALRSPSLAPATAGAYGIGGMRDVPLEPAGSALLADFTALRKRSTRPAQASDSAQPVERRPRANLETNEADGAHTIAKHVGKSARWLRRRVASGEASVASRFTNRAAANQSIVEFRKANRTDLDSWAADPTSTAKMTRLHVSKHVVGQVLRADGQHLADSRTTRVVVVKDSSQQGWHIVTAFPVEDARR